MTERKWGVKLKNLSTLVMGKGASYGRDVKPNEIWQHSAVETLISTEIAGLRAFRLVGLNFWCAVLFSPPKY